MAYDPITGDLSNVPLNPAPSIIDEAIAAVEPESITQQPKLANKNTQRRVFSALVIFTVVVLALAVTAAGLLFVNFQANSSQLVSNSDQQVNNEESDIAEDSDSQTEENQPETTEEPDLTEPPDTGNTIPDTWLPLSILQNDVGFALPPAESPHTYTQDSQTWTWIFKDSGVLATDLDVLGEYAAAAYIGFLPAERELFSCEPGCIQENMINIYQIDYTNTLDIAFAEIEQRVADAKTELGENPSAPNIELAQKVEIWGTEAYQLNLSGLGYDPLANYYLVATGQHRYIVYPFTASRDEQSKQDMQLILSSLEFE